MAEENPPESPKVSQKCEEECAEKCVEKGAEECAEECAEPNVQQQILCEDQPSCQQQLLAELQTIEAAKSSCSRLLPDKIKVVLFLSSVRQGRVCERVGKCVSRYLEKTDHAVTIIDPLDLGLPVLQKTSSMYADPGEMPTKLQDVIVALKNADAIIVVSGEYNHCIQPALSNTLDTLPSDAFAYKPAAIVTYSSEICGGIGAGIQLRSLLAELGCVTMPAVLALPEATNTISEEGETAVERVEEGMIKLILQLDWFSHAIRNHRATCEIPTL